MNIETAQLDAAVGVLKIGLSVIGALLLTIGALVAFMWRTLNSKLDILSTKIDLTSDHASRITSAEQEILRLRNNHQDLVDKIIHTLVAKQEALYVWKDEHTRLIEAQLLRDTEDAKRRR